MKLAKLLLFSVEALSVLATATVLDFTSTTLPQNVNSYTLKEKSPGDSREVKLFTAEFEDGFNGVLEGNLKVWGDDKKYGCEYAKVYLNEGKAVALKLAFHLKGFAITRTNTQHSFLVKKNGKWNVVDRRTFWATVSKTFVFNYAHESYEHDEKFEPVRAMDFVAEDPSVEMEHRRIKLPAPRFPRVVSTERVKRSDSRDSGDAKPMTELFGSSDKTGASTKAHARTKAHVHGDSANPLIELQRLSDERRDKQYRLKEAEKEQKKNVGVFTELHRSSADVMDMTYKKEAAKPKAVKPKGSEEYSGPITEMLRSTDNTMLIDYQVKDRKRKEHEGEGPLSELLRSTDDTMKIENPSKLRKNENVTPVESDKSSFLASSLLLPAVLMIFYSSC